MVIGERLKELREQNGLSLDELASWLQMSKSQLIRYESGDSGMTAETFIKIAEFYKVSLDYLAGRTKNRYVSDKVFRLDISVAQLLRTLPPIMVARFIKALGIEVRLDWSKVKVIDDEPVPDNADDGILPPDL